jgi:hypothetical protein
MEGVNEYRVTVQSERIVAVWQWDRDTRLRILWTIYEGATDAALYHPQVVNGVAAKGIPLLRLERPIAGRIRRELKKTCQHQPC